MVYTIGGNYEESSNKSTLSNKLVIQVFEEAEETIYQTETSVANAVLGKKTKASHNQWFLYSPTYNDKGHPL